MSKGHDGAASQKKHDVKPSEGKHVEGKHSEGKPPEGKQNEGKHPESKHGHGENRSTKGKGHTPLPGGCFSWGCKVSASRFNFCDEHYEHFKFGLIKKTGEPVPDYEKKIEHFLAHKARKGAQRVA